MFWEFVVTTWWVVGLAWAFFLSIVLATVYRASEKRLAARLLLSAPIWPLVTLYAVYLGIKHVVALAFDL